MTRTLQISAVSLILLGTQCQSGPSLERAVEIQDEDRVVVSYRQPRREFQQTLLTETVVDRSALYSSSNSDPYSKVLTTGGMQVLLDGLATYDFFDRSTTQPPPTSSAEIEVRINDERRVWGSGAAQSEDDRRQFLECVSAFQNIFNATRSYHVSKGGEDVLEEHKKLEANREEYFRKERDKQ